MPNLYQDWNKYTAWVEWMYECKVAEEVVRKGLIILLTRDAELHVQPTNGDGTAHNPISHEADADNTGKGDDPNTARHSVGG